jgi:hypothetical protein
VLKRWLGPLITLLIVGGVAVILLANLQTGRGRSSAPGTDPQRRDLAPGGNASAAPQKVLRPTGASFREYPIGEEVERDAMRIAAVWLPSVEFDGQTVRPGSDVIHLEADIHATAGNPNGFGLGEFVPYLKISYQIEPPVGGPIIEGTMVPMVASDGPHYGTSLSMPKAGKYRLTLRIEPPSANGMGRHHDPVTGVAPWWRPFQASFDWDYPGPQGEEEAPK